MAAHTYCSENTNKLGKEVTAKRCGGLEAQEDEEKALAVTLAISWNAAILPFLWRTNLEAFNYGSGRDGQVANWHECVSPSATQNDSPKLKNTGTQNSKAQNRKQKQISSKQSSNCAKGCASGTVTEFTLQK